jgi:Family of unknown function (DUF6879)
MMLDAQALGARLRAARHDLFRIEALDRYAVPTDGGDYQRYLDGEPEPDPARKAAWHERLAAERARGLYRRRIHVIHEPLSDYLRFEFDWGHRLNAHLEDIRVLALAHPPSAQDWHDFWMVDDRDVLAMAYGADGQFEGALPVLAGNVRLYRMIRDAAWEAAVPFTDWWDAHPQYHRHVSVA